jgi:hypothetical protein
MDNFGDDLLKPICQYFGENPIANPNDGDVSKTSDVACG